MVDYRLCRCGKVLRVGAYKRKVKTFQDPIGTIKDVDEMKDHYCQTFDFGAGLKKETKNQKSRI